MSFLKLTLIGLALVINFPSEVEVRDDLKIFFDEYDQEGCFVLYDLKDDKYIINNKERAEKEFIPASTFKIFNSLAALETEAVKDENEIIKWDGENRQYKKWNQDLNLKQAYKYSAVWFYQELARRIGEEKMQQLIDENSYGNGNISGGIDRFWLDGELRITPMEQVRFLQRLYENDLSFSKRTIRIVQEVMIYDEAEDYTMSAKTGWGFQNDTSIGWFVGYIEVDKNVYFFATNVEADEPGEGFKSRIEITYNILKNLEILP